MAKSLELDIANVTSTGVDADGYLEVQHDAEGEQNAGVPGGQACYPHGLWSRPIDPQIDPASGQPIPSKACRVLTMYEGGVLHSMPLDDPRVVAALPAINAGETILYGDFGNFFRLHADGSCSIATTDKGGNPTGRTVALRVTPTEKTFDSPWGQERFDQSAWKMVHTPSGARITAGGIGGLPGPLGQLSSYIRMQAALIEINATALTLGPSGGIAQNVVQAQAFYSEVLVPIAAALGGIAAALEGLQITVDPSMTKPCTPPIQAAVPLCAAAVTAIAISLPTVSTQCAIS